MGVYVIFANEIIKQRPCPSSNIPTNSNTALPFPGCYQAGKFRQKFDFVAPFSFINLTFVPFCSGAKYHRCISHY